MTIDEEPRVVQEESTSTPEVTATTAQPTDPEKPGIFKRICCCYSNSSDVNEPPVQLIRSGSLTYKQGSQQVENVISAANGTIGGEDVNLELRKEEPKKNGTAPDKLENGEFNMNDILMEGVIKNTEENDKTEAVEEDVTSISTDVIQEIDETEIDKVRNELLKKLDENNHPVPIQQKLKGRSGISKSVESISIHSDNEETESGEKKMSVIDFIKSEAEIKNSGRSDEKKVGDNEKLSEATRSEISDSEEESDDDNDTEAEKKLSVPLGTSSKTTARKSGDEAEKEEQTVQDYLEFNELSRDGLEESDNENDEIMMIEQSLTPPPVPSFPPPPLSSDISSSPVPLPRSPIPPPRSPHKSTMYAHADSDSDTDSDSEDEGSGEAQPVSSSGLAKSHPVTFASSPILKNHDESSDNTDSDEEMKSTSSKTVSSEGLSGKENEGVTRISVKSDGRAEIHGPKSPVSVTLNTDRHELTDDEFSEKLI